MTGSLTDRNTTVRTETERTGKGKDRKLYGQGSVKMDEQRMEKGREQDGRRTVRTEHRTVKKQ